MKQKSMIGLNDVAARLGVHYMTAYWFARLGVIPACKVGHQWRIDPDRLEARLAELDTTKLQAMMPPPRPSPMKGRRPGRPAALPQGQTTLQAT